MPSALIKKKGFTLLEVMTTLVVLIILTGIAIAVMPGMMRRSYTIEGVAALNSIRTQLRMERAKTGAYDTNAHRGRVINNVPGFGIGDLVGTYFIDNNYSITAITPNTFTVTLVGTRPPVRFVIVTINQDGAITIADGCAGCGRG